MAYRKARPLLRAPQGAPPLNLSDPLAAKLGGCFFLNDGGGRLALDSGLARRNGTLVGAATWRASAFGTVVSIPGSGNVTVPDYPGISPPGDTPFTICTWAYQNVLQNYNSLGGKTTGNYADPFDWYITADGILHTLLTINSAGTYSLDGASPTAAGRWQHHALTVNMVHAVGLTATQYLDGVPNGSSFAGVTTNSSTGKPLLIGTRDDGVTQMDGMFFAWMCFPNSCLSQSEIQQLRAETWRMLAPPRLMRMPSGSTTVAGTLAITQANQTLVAAGWSTRVGTLAVTQANQTLVSAAAVQVRGTLAVTQANQTLAATGGIISTGTLNITQANQTFAAVGNVRVDGALAVTEALDTLVGIGHVDVWGAVNTTEAPDTLAATGSGTVVGTLVITEALDTITATGSGTIVGTLAVTEALDTIAATGELTVSGTLGVTEDPDTLAATGWATRVGTLAVTEALDTLAATGVLTIGGMLAITEALDTLTANGFVFSGNVGGLTLTQANQVLAATGFTPLVSSQTRVIVMA